MLGVRPLQALAVLLALAAAPARADRDTTFSLPALGAAVRIVTDVHGIPHLMAHNLADLYFAWGFVTARDRLWQLEHARRAARGELWQWFGNRALQGDGGAQLFELAQHAERVWRKEREHSGTRTALESFAAGVNAYLALCRTGSQPWPHEFVRLGKRPQDWRPSDVVLALFAMGVLLDFAIPELAEAETLRLRGPRWFEQRRRFEKDWIYATIPDSAAQRLYGRRPRPRLPGTPFSSPDTRSGWTAPGLPAERDREQRASNVFAVGPARSASRAPILANDIHLRLVAPGSLYAVHVSVPDTVEAAGVCVPGLPIVVSGRNPQAAWGITSLTADVLDVYADTLSADGRSVRWRGGWAKLREEPYRMQFQLLGVPLPLFWQKRRYTPGGPVLVHDRKRRLALSVRWTALEAEVTLRDLIGLERARDARELARRARSVQTPTLNMLVADAAGRVIYQTVGAVPRRGFDPVHGVLPADQRHAWRGLIAPEGMPSWEAPANGFVVNCNNLPVGPWYPEAFARFDWMHDRAVRIAQRLAADPHVTLDDARSVQNDVFARAAQRFVPRLLACADSLAGELSPTARAALDTLRHWDFLCLRDRVAPTLFRAWLGAFQRRSALEDVPGLAAAALDGRAPGVLRDPERGGLERPAIAAARSLEEALEELERQLGPDPARWFWGWAHRARFRHALAWRHPGFDPPTIPVDGDNSTPSAGPSRLPRDLHVTHAPVWRHLVDLAVTDSSLAILPPGNTGTPQHDRDHLQRWANHRYVPFYLDWGRIEAVKESEWRLEPGPGRR